MDHPAAVAEPHPADGRAPWWVFGQAGDARQPQAPAEGDHPVEGLVPKRGQIDDIDSGLFQLLFPSRGSAEVDRRYSDGDGSHLFNREDFEGLLHFGFDLERGGEVALINDAENQLVADAGWKLAIEGQDFEGQVELDVTGNPARPLGKTGPSQAERRENEADRAFHSHKIIQTAFRNKALTSSGASL